MSIKTKRKETAPAKPRIPANEVRRKLQRELDAAEAEAEAQIQTFGEKINAMSSRLAEAPVDLVMRLTPDDREELTGVIEDLVERIGSKSVAGKLLAHLRDLP